MTKTQSIFQNVQKLFTAAKSRRYLAVGVVFLLLVGVAVAGYRWYDYDRHQKAQYDFARAVELFEKAERSNDSAEWESVENTIAQKYALHAATSWAAPLLAYQADACWKLNKRSQAIALMDKAVAHLGKRSLLYPSYAIKRALLKIDSGDSLVLLQGVKELEDYAYDKAFPERDKALYYLGLYSYSNQKCGQARSVWNELIRDFGPSSIWVQSAQAHLDYTA